MEADLIEFIYFIDSIQEKITILYCNLKFKLRYQLNLAE